MKWMQAYAYTAVYAVILLSVACGDNPAVAHYNRGLDYEASGQYRLAIQQYDKAIELDVNYTDDYHKRGNAYNQLGNL